MSHESDSSPWEGRNRREAIVRSALTLFARYGYAGTSVRRIAEEAGVSRSLMYLWFPGKRELLDAIFQQRMAELERSWEVAGRGGSPADRLGRLIRAWVEVVHSDPITWRFIYQLRLQPDVLAELGREVPAPWAALEPQCEELFAQCGATDAAAEARTVVAALDGGVQHFLLDPERYPLREIGEVLVRRFVTPGAAAGSGAGRPRRPR